MEAQCLINILIVSAVQNTMQWYALLHCILKPLQGCFVSTNTWIVFYCDIYLSNIGAVYKSEEWALLIQMLVLCLFLQQRAASDQVMPPSWLVTETQQLLFGVCLNCNYCANSHSQRVDAVYIAFYFFLICCFMQKHCSEYVLHMVTHWFCTLLFQSYREDAVGRLVRSSVLWEDVSAHHLFHFSYKISIKASRGIFTYSAAGFRPPETYTHACRTHTPAQAIIISIHLPRLPVSFFMSLTEYQFVFYRWHSQCASVFICWMWCSVSHVSITHE